MLDKFVKKEQRKNRIRAKISGTAVRPRLSVSASNKHITAQLIDDDNQKTLVYVSDVKSENKVTKTASAGLVGERIAEAAKKIKISEVVFDRGGKLYHGRVKALADGARKGGLKF
jgi:large subunit ribosomal protein L18